MLVVALVACGGSDSGPDEGQPTGGPGTATGPAPDGTATPGDPSRPTDPTKPADPPFAPARRFATAAKVWTLPAGVLDGTAPGNTRGAIWDFLDMDGDGRLDLVQSASATGEIFGGAASPHWRVFRNNGSGFDATPISWSVPSDRFKYLNNVGYGLVDLDADGKLDLVDMSPEGGPSVWGHASGTPHFRLHRGQAGGFAAAPTTWTLPATVPAGQATAGALPGSKDPYLSVAAWKAIDVDGDGKLELVDSTSKPWKIYRQAPAGGFSPTPSMWSVPTMSGDSKQQYLFNALTGHLWSTLDLDGDGFLDLVATGRTIGSARLAFETAAKTPYWKMYKGSATGFASSSTNWIVPSAAEYPEDFDRFGPMTDTFDIDGDGKLDLVTMGRTDPYGVVEGKAPYWRVYFGSTSGFGRTKSGAAPTNLDPGPSVATDLAYEWPLPIAKVGTEGVISRRGAGWAVLDLDGDKRTDLVVLKATGLDVYLGAP